VGKTHAVSGRPQSHGNVAVFRPAPLSRACQGLRSPRSRALSLLGFPAEEAVPLDDGLQYRRQARQVVGALTPRNISGKAPALDLGGVASRLRSTVQKRGHAHLRGAFGIIVASMRLHAFRPTLAGVRKTASRRRTALNRIRRRYGRRIDGDARRHSDTGATCAACRRATSAGGAAFHAIMQVLAMAPAASAPNKACVHL